MALSTRSFRPLQAVRSLPVGQRALHVSRPVRDSDGFRINDLMAKFKDTSSPYYMAPGEVGPASPDDHTVSRPLPGQKTDWTPPPFSTGEERSPKLPHMDRGYDRARATGHEWFDSNAFDPEGRIEWPVAWGDSDMYRHINNVAYCKYVESARMRWIASLVPDLGDVGEDFLYGRRTAFILKEQTVRYRFPVTYPDSLLIATKPHSINKERGQFKCATAMWSLKENKLVCTAESTAAMYDFDNVRKGVMSDLVYDVLTRRAQGP